MHKKTLITLRLQVCLTFAVLVDGTYLKLCQEKITAVNYWFSRDTLGEKHNLAFILICSACCEFKYKPLLLYTEES